MSLITVAAAISLQAQTYQVGPDTSHSSQAPSSSAQPQLGWGSNIQNARLGHAAEEALWRGDYGRAVEYAQRAAQAAPGDSELWFLLGYAARLDGKYPLALDAYNHGLSLKPSSLDGKSGLAGVYALSGRPADAERILREVIAADPRRRDDEMFLGDLYMKSLDYSNAIDWIDRAERAHPDARSELLLALCYEHLNKLDQATRYLEMAKHRAPGDPDVERALAGFYRETGKYDDAINELKAIRNPKPDVIAELAYTYQLDAKTEDAARTYAIAAKAEPKNIDYQLSAAQAQVAIGSITDANSFLARAAAIDANNYRLHATRAEIAQMQEHYPESLSEYKAALANLPANPPEGALYRIQLHMNLVALYHELGDENAAQSELDTSKRDIAAVNVQPADRGAFLRLRALIRLNSDDLNGALSDIRDALAINSSDRNDLQLDGDILMKLGRSEEAMAVYKKILAADPNNRLALTAAGYAARALGNEKDAERYFEKLAAVDPSSYVPYLALGDLYAAHRDFGKAETAYSKGYSLAPQNAFIVAGGMYTGIESHNLPLAKTWLDRVTAEIKTNAQVMRETERYLSFAGKYQESASVGEQAIQKLPRDRDVVVYLGYDLLHLERYDELLALTQKYLEILPKEVDLALLQGYVHKHRNQNEEALQDFTEAIKRDPNVVTAHVNRGYILNDLHRPQEAAPDFEFALKMEPNNGEAHLGLAYSSLDMNKYQAAIHQADLAEKFLGESKGIHVIRATAYGSEGMLVKAAGEYRAAIAMTPDDGALYFGLGGTLFAERQYHEAIENLDHAEKLTPSNPTVEALLARSHAELQERNETQHYVQLAEEHVSGRPGKEQSGIYLSTGDALSTIGEESAAYGRFEKALTINGGDRVGVRLAIARLMVHQDHSDDAERQVALAMMEAEGGDAAPPSGGELLEAADIFRSLHEYQLSQNYLQRAKAAGAPDPQVRIGMADNYLAMGDTTRAEAELAAVHYAHGDAPDYQYLLAEANVYSQKHQNAQALTAFAQASNVQGEDQAADQQLLQAGANEGLRVTPTVSLLSDFSVAPIFEDPTVYVLDSKLDATFAVPPSDISLLPPPRSSLQTEWTDAFHLHLGKWPTPSGFFQIRNARGPISVPATNSIVNRNTTDYTVNFGLNPTVHLGDNAITFDGGIQETLRRDSLSPRDMNQNLFRAFAYVSTSSFFNALSVSGFITREAGPFTESNLSSSTVSAGVDFRVGSPWGKTALVTGWGRSNELFSPVSYQNYFTSAYIGVERKFSPRLDLKVLAEDVRAWRIVGSKSGIAQNLRPAASLDFIPKRNWDVQVSTAFSSARGFHVYDTTENGFAVSYAMPIRRKFHEDAGDVLLKYPIRFSAGVQEQDFFNFSGAQSQQFRPYVEISIF